MSSDPTLRDEHGESSPPLPDQSAGAGAEPAVEPAADAVPTTSAGEQEPTDPVVAADDRAKTDTDERNAAVTAFRSTVGQRLDTLVSQIVAVSEQHAERLKAQLHAALEGAALAWSAQLRAIENGQAQQELRGAVDAARIAERECDLECMARLLDGIRHLDAADSLTEILDRVSTHAFAFVPGRAATFIVRDKTITEWKTRGFENGTAISDIDITLHSHSVVAAAVLSGEPRTTRDADNACLDPLTEAPLADDRVALVVPMLVGGRTAALLYADDVTATAEPTVPSAWPEALEILARHAASCLEKLTIATAYGLHTVQVVRGGAEGGLRPENGASVPGVSRPEGLPRDENVGSLSEGDGEEESAQRYARLLVSEIKLYHEDAVNEGRQQGDLLARLEGEILRARQLYEQRVPIEVRIRSDYFGQELIRTLADGDARLLGQAR